MEKYGASRFSHVNKAIKNNAGQEIHAGAGRM
jgi:hypothetical protein